MPLCTWSPPDVIFCDDTGVQPRRSTPTAELSPLVIELFSANTVYQRDSDIFDRSEWSRGTYFQLLHLCILLINVFLGLGSYIPIRICLKLPYMPLWVSSPDAAGKNQSSYLYCFDGLLLSECDRRCCWSRISLLILSLDELRLWRSFHHVAIILAHLSD